MLLCNVFLKLLTELYLDHTTKICFFYVSTEEFFLSVLIISTRKKYKRDQSNLRGNFRGDVIDFCPTYVA